MTGSCAEDSINHKIIRVTSTIFPSNTYLCAIGQSNGCIVIDPGLDGELINGLLLEYNLEPTHIFCTHGHFDHIGSASFLQKKYSAKVFLHSADIKTAQTSNFMLMAFKLSHQIKLPIFDELYEDLSSIPVGNTCVNVYRVPGHTPGSCIIQFGSALFTGDTLYSRSVGLSRLPKENPEQLRSSIRTYWNHFSDDSIIYPGHGESASFGWIRQNNKALLDFISSSSMSKDENKWE